MDAVGGLLLHDIASRANYLTFKLVQDMPSVVVVTDCTIIYLFAEGTFNFNILLRTMYTRV